jgi:hypothetical protein
MKKCSNNFQNTAGSNCRQYFDIVEKILFFPNKNIYLQGNDEDDIVEDIEAKIQAATKYNRCFVFPLIKGLEDNSEDLKTAQTGYGDTVILADGKQNYTFQYLQDVELTKRLRSFNNQEGRVILVCSDGSIICEKKDNKIYGFLATPYFRQGRLPNGNDLVVSTINLSFSDATAMEDRVTILDLGLIPSEIDGLKDITIQMVGSDKKNFKLIDTLTGEDVTSAYGTLLAVVGGWLVDGANPGTAPTYDSVNKKFTFTTAATTSVSLADPAALAALSTPVLGIESDVLAITA